MRLAYILLFIIIAGALFMNGCTTKIDASNRYVTNWASELEKNKMALYNPNYTQECKVGECICMVCKNSSSWFGMVSSLTGGFCHFEKPCPVGRIMNISLPPDKTKGDQCAGANEDSCDSNLVTKQFMFGSGVSFADFADANSYCKNRMQMAVQWLVGTEEEPYQMPDHSRAECFLDKEIMPVYVLYSGSTKTKAWDRIDRTRKIAAELKKVGPIIVTTEIDFNSSDATLVQEVAEQIKAIDQYCGNERTGDQNKWKLYCMIALAPKMNDGNAVEKVKKALGTDFKKVDLIAYGINSHSATSCEPKDLWADAQNFSRHMLYNYSKPTVIPYILFDSSGDVKDKTTGSTVCQWSESTMTSGYLMFSDNIFQLHRYGLIGVAPYDFNSSSYTFSNPLNCEDCSLGKNNARLASWYSFCQSWAMQSAQYPDGIMPIRFPNESGGNCDDSTGGHFLFQQQYSSGGGYKDFTAGQPPSLDKPEEPLVRCDACLNENNVWPISSVKLKAPKAELGEKACTSYPEADSIASSFNVDPMLVRAIALDESGMDRCSAALVNPSGGLDPGCYPKGYDKVPDPEGDCNKADKKAEPGTDGKPLYRYCGLGIMQSLEPPYTFWPKEYNPEKKDGIYYTGASTGEQLYLEAKNAGRSGNLAAAKMCSEKFNPFNASHSICVGSFKLAGYIKAGEQILSNAEKKYSNLFGTVSSTSNVNVENKRRIMATYFALHLYRGRTTEKINTWIDHYYIKWTQYDQAHPICQKGTPSVCECPKDFVEYMGNCVIYNSYLWGELYQRDYAADILGYYRWLTEHSSSGGTVGCTNAYCPSWRKPASKLCPGKVPPDGEQAYPYKSSTSGTTSTTGSDRC